MERDRGGKLAYPEEELMAFLCDGRKLKKKSEL